MSNKLAKVLVICALVVVLPLFVAGTVIAVYNSLNSTINVEVYTGEKEEGRVYPQEPTITSDAGVEQVDNEGVLSYKVTNGLNKQTKLEFTAVGYNFVGWFNGTRAEYVQAIGDLQDGEQIEFIQEVPNQVLSINQKDYSNITAVFEVVSYNFEFYYQQTPNGEFLTTAPNGKTEYIYGEQLPIFADTDTHDFMGWVIYDKNAQTEIGEPSKVANFTTTEGLTLKAVWQEVKTYRVEYYDENENFIPNSEQEITTRNYSSTPLRSLTSHSKAGYTAYWEDINGNVVTSFTQEILEENEQSLTIKLYLSTSANDYTAIFTGANGATFVGGLSTATFTIEGSSKLSKFGVDANWSHSDGYSYTVASYSYNGNTYPTIDALVDAITKDNPKSQVSVQVNFERAYEQYTIVYYMNGESVKTQTFKEDTLPSIALNSLQQENLGYNLTYKYNNTPVSVVTPEMINENRDDHTIDIDVTRSIINFTVYVLGGDYGYTGNRTINVNVENYSSSLTYLVSASSWERYSNVYDFKGISYAGQTHNSTTSLWNAIITNYYNNSTGTSITVTPIVDELVHTLVLTNGIRYEDGVEKVGGDLQDSYIRIEYTMSTTIIGNILDPNATYQLDGNKVVPNQIKWNDGEGALGFDIDELNGNTIAAFVDYVLDHGIVNDSGTVVISYIEIRFA